MNSDNATIQDCEDMFYFRGKAVLLNDGHVIGFEKENIPADYQSKQG